MTTSVALSKETDEVRLCALISYSYSYSYSYSKRHEASKASIVNEMLFPAGKSLFLRGRGNKCQALHENSVTTWQ